MGASSSTSSSNHSDIEELSNILKLEMERQIALQNLKFETEMAVKRAKDQDNFVWETIAGGTTLIGTMMQSILTKNRVYAVPIIPIVMYLGYRYEFIYGKTAEKIQSDADKLYKTKPELCKLIGGPITLQELDLRRNAWSNNQDII